MRNEHVETDRETVIQIADLQVAYGERPILKGIDAEVRRGEVVVILGGSGCGKTTLLKSIIGLMQPVSGQMALLGEDLAQLDEPAWERLRRRIGVMFQYGALLNSLTVGENVALPLDMHTDLRPELIEAIVATRLEMVGLRNTAERLVSELSGGMRKRAALARAMAMDPEILFCDEPGAGLDPVTGAGIDRLLLTLNRSLGTTLVVVTHELLSIERLNGRLIMLDAGKVIFTGSFKEAQGAAHPVVRNFFHSAAVDQR